MDTNGAYPGEQAHASLAILAVRQA